MKYWLRAAIHTLLYIYIWVSQCIKHCVCECVSIVTRRMSFVPTMLVHVSQVFVCLFCSDLPPRLFPGNPRVSLCYQVIFVKGPPICACPLRTLCADISLFLFFHKVNHHTHNPITVGLQKQATGTQKMSGQERKRERDRKIERGDA